MAADKTIFQCPVISLVSELDGGNRLVIQKANASLQDNGVPLSILAKWVKQNSFIAIYSGSSNPDNAQGANGDQYFQTNGKIYQKVAGSWVLKANLGILPQVAPLIFTVAAGQPFVYTLTSPQLATVNSMSKYPTFQAFIGGDGFEDIKAHYDGSPGSFTNATIQLHNNGSGLNADTTTVQFS